MEYHLAKRRNKPLTRITTRMNFKSTLSSESSQTERAARFTVPFRCHSGEDELKTKRSGQLLQSAEWRGDGTLGVQKTFCNSTEVVVEWLHTFVKTHHTGHLKKQVNFVICRLHLQFFFQKINGAGRPIVKGLAKHTEERHTVSYTRRLTWDASRRPHWLSLSKPAWLVWALGVGSKFSPLSLKFMPPAVQWAYLDSPGYLEGRVMTIKYGCEQE